MVAEPKWDGSRACLVREGDTATLWSRAGTDLTRHFPDLEAAAAAQVPPGCVLDGEIVAFTSGRHDFSSLQHRLTTSRRALADLVRRKPASFVAFDVLAVAGHDVRHLSLRDRRALLTELAADWEPTLQLSPLTTDLEEAARWFAELHLAGIEGLVFKGAGQPYRTGRIWLKLKHRHTTEVVCGAVTGTLDRPESLIAGLPIDGRLRIVGRTTPLHPSAAHSVAVGLRHPTGDHPWPDRIHRRAVDRSPATSNPRRHRRVTGRHRCREMSDQLDRLCRGTQERGPSGEWRKGTLRASGV